MQKHMRKSAYNKKKEEKISAKTRYNTRKCKTEMFETSERERSRAGINVLFALTDF